MGRVILHADANCFYASVECLYRPQYRGRALAVCGDPEARHGIVLTATYPAKRAGVKVGMAIWQARQVCPSLICVPPDYALYMHFSALMSDIWHEYSDRVEAFGLDESWIDVSGYDMDIKKGALLADVLRERVKKELGITVSIGVADNKVFAKLGSDMKKPDGTTAIWPGHMRDTVWPLPVSDLLYVGPATARKLARLNIRTVGGLALADEGLIASVLGKNGIMLQHFARGEDASPVQNITFENVVKSIGNSVTAPRDLETEEDAFCVLTLLCESVGARLREHGFLCSGLSVGERSTELAWKGHQTRLNVPTDLNCDLLDCAKKQFHRCCAENLPLRGLSVCAFDLTPASAPRQLCFEEDAVKRLRAEQLDRAVDTVRARFGPGALLRGNVLQRPVFSSIHPKEDHTIHPVALLRGGA